jgi:methylated-DNA-protein-cysteine methyltransferase related protein
MAVKQDIINYVHQVPFGKVVSFGQISDLVGVSAQLVGWILSGFTDEEIKTIPWHRVVNKKGEISALKLGWRGNEQIRRLELEGVLLEDNVVNMNIYRFYFDKNDEEYLL